MTEAIAAVTGAVQLVNEYSELFMADSETKERKTEQNNSLLRGYYLELVENSNILKAINFNSGIDKNPLDAAKAIAPLLQNEFGKILCPNIKNQLKTSQIKQNQILKHFLTSWKNIRWKNQYIFL